MRLGDLDALKEEISGACYNCASRGEDDYNCKYHCTIYDFLKHIDNAPTLEPNNEYGAIQYSNGFNDGFTLAKDTIIQNIAKQYSAHNELVPEWLSIADMRGEEE